MDISDAIELAVMVEGLTKSGMEIRFFSPSWMGGVPCCEVTRTRPDGVKEQGNGPTTGGKFSPTHALRDALASLKPVEKKGEDS